MKLEVTAGIVFTFVTYYLIIKWDICIQNWTKMQIYGNSLHANELLFN